MDCVCVILGFEPMAYELTRQVLYHLRSPWILMKACSHGTTFILRVQNNLPLPKFLPCPLSSNYVPLRPLLLETTAFSPHGFTFFSEYYRNRITVGSLWVWHLSLNTVHLRFIHVIIIGGSFLVLFFFLVLGIEPRALCVPSFSDC
jgi:hypothetical protein